MPYYRKRAALEGIGDNLLVAELAAGRVNDVGAPAQRANRSARDSSELSPQAPSTMNRHAPTTCANKYSRV
eukprot:6414513-Pyramimonas_sp.AAC.1